MQRVATGFGLIEGPVWDASGLYFSDVINGGVHLLDRADKVSLVVPKRRGIGGMALHASDGLVVGGRDIAFVRLADGHTRTLLALDAIAGATQSRVINTGYWGASLSESLGVYRAMMSRCHPTPREVLAPPTRVASSQDPARRHGPPTGPAHPRGRRSVLDLPCAQPANGRNRGPTFACLVVPLRPRRAVGASQHG